MPRLTKMCEFPTCSYEFNVKDFGGGGRKYCKPHSEVVRKAKRKMYSAKYVAEKKKLTLVNKIKSDKKCEECGVSVMEYSLKKQWCKTCLLEKQRVANVEYRKRKSFTKHFDRIRISLANNLIAYKVK